MSHRNVLGLGILILWYCLLGSQGYVKRWTGACLESAAPRCESPLTDRYSYAGGTNLFQFCNLQLYMVMKHSIMYEIGKCKSIRAISIRAIKALTCSHKFLLLFAIFCCPSSLRDPPSKQSLKPLGQFIILFNSIHCCRL